MIVILAWWVVGFLFTLGFIKTSNKNIHYMEDFWGFFLWPMFWGSLVATHLYDNEDNK